MKKLLSLSIAFIFSISLINQAAAQNQQDDPFNQQVKVGIGLAFASGIGSGSLDNDLGIRVDGYYPIRPLIRVGGDFTFYFPKSEGDFTFTVWELNFNGNYYFLEEDELNLYGLAGINITGFTFSNGGSSSDSEIGLNLGAGVEYPLDFADLFGEFKFGGIGGDADQFVLGAGLRFAF